MPKDKKNKHDNKSTFYLHGVELLANKFITQSKSKGSEISNLKEGLERKFDVWAKDVIADRSIRDDVWKRVVERLMKKNG